MYMDHKQCPTHPEQSHEYGRSNECKCSCTVLAEQVNTKFEL